MLITVCVTFQPEACYPWLQKPIDVGSWTVSENLITEWQDLFPVFLSTNFLVRGHSCVSSHIVSGENPCCVSDRLGKHRRVCCHFKRRDFIFENCQICSSKSTHRGDGFSQRLQCSDGSVSAKLAVEIASLVLPDDILCHFVQQQLKNSFFVSMQVTYPLCCCGNNIGHVHLLGELGTIAAWMAPEEVYASTRKHAICSGLRHPCTRSQTEVDAQTASIFDCSRCGESRPRDSTDILHQG